MLCYISLQDESIKKQKENEAQNRDSLKKGRRLEILSWDIAEWVRLAVCDQTERNGA